MFGAIWGAILGFSNNHKLGRCHTWPHFSTAKGLRNTRPTKNSPVRLQNVWHYFQPLPISCRKWLCQVDCASQPLQLFGHGRPHRPVACRNPAQGHHPSIFAGSSRTCHCIFIQADFQVGKIKKWHWQLRSPDLLDKLGNLPSCFTAERKHKSISALATRLQKTSAYKKKTFASTGCGHRDHHPAGARFVATDCHPGEAQSS